MSSYLIFKKQYIAFFLVVFVLLFVLTNRPSYHCQESDVLEDLLTNKLSFSDVNTINDSENLPIIYGITPTYSRLVQKADLTRLSQTLMNVKNFHWIVVEDSATKTTLVRNLLKESKLKYTHLNAKTIKLKKDPASGVEQRNAALNWLRKYLNKAEDQTGVVYFMDDDNTYALRIFDEIRRIKKVGIWPVGLVGGMRVEMPVVKDGKVVGFNAEWKPFRPFPIDMAGFAINVSLILEHEEANFSRTVQSGYQESEILKYVVTVDELEPLADNCTKVYVWHTRTQKPVISHAKVVNPKTTVIDTSLIEV